ncbi:hypothetical protein KIPB_011475, partial [Kipferlia bialata]|eukprot:g11475.t1
MALVSALRREIQDLKSFSVSQPAMPMSFNPAAITRLGPLTSALSDSLQAYPDEDLLREARDIAERLSHLAACIPMDGAQDSLAGISDDEGEGDGDCDISFVPAHTRNAVAGSVALRLMAERLGGMAKEQATHSDTLLVGRLQPLLGQMIEDVLQMERREQGTRSKALVAGTSLKLALSSLNNLTEQATRRTHETLSLSLSASGGETPAVDMQPKVAVSDLAGVQQMVIDTINQISGLTNVSLDPHSESRLFA